MIATLTVNPALDLSTHISGLVPEKKIRCTMPDYFPGGGGVNVSRALARLGKESLCLFTAGGPSGKRIENLLKEENIKIQPIETDVWTRENLTVRDDASGSQYRFTFPGSPLPESDIERIITSLKSIAPFPEYLVLSGSFPPDFRIEFLDEIKQLCDSNNSKLIIDTSGPFLAAAAKKGPFLLKPNYQELCEMAEIQSSELHDVQRIGQKVIQDYGIEILVVSLGANGASIISKSEYLHVHAPRVPVKSTVGAGDSLLAGVVFALDSGHTLKEVLKWGVACGTATTMNEGTGLFQLDQVEKVKSLIR